VSPLVTLATLEPGDGFIEPESGLRGAVTGPATLLGVPVALQLPSCLQAELLPSDALVRYEEAGNLPVDMAAEA